MALKDLPDIEKARTFGAIEKGDHKVQRQKMVTQKLARARKARKSPSNDRA